MANEFTASSWGDKMTLAWARFVIANRWRVLLVCALVSLIAAASIAMNIRVSTDFRVFFGPGNPQVLAFDRIESEYSKVDQISFILEPEEGTVLTPRVLESMRWLTAESWKLPYSTRVDSLSNFQHTEANGFELRVQPLLPLEGEITEADVARVAEVALAEPQLRDSIISTDNMAKDGQYGAVVVTFTLPGDALSETPDAVDAARELEQRYLAKYPGVQVYMTGPTMLNMAFVESTNRDVAVLTPLQYLAIGIVLWLLLRSVASLVATMMVVAASALAAFGISSALGIVVTSMTSVAPTIIMTLAVADSIHLLVTMLVRMRVGVDKESALTESLRLNMAPVLLTSVTTAVGFLSLNFSDSPPLRDLGNISAIGVMLAFAFSVALLPALIMVLPVKPRQSEDRIAHASERYGAWLVGRWKPALLLSIAVASGLVWTAQYNTFGNDDFVRYFSEEVRFRNDTDFARDHYSGFMGVYYDMDTGEDWGIAEPAYLRKLEAFEAWWRLNPDVTAVRSIVPMMKRINKAMEEGAESAYAIPDARELAVDNLMMYEMGLPFGLDTTNQINMDKSGSVLAVVFADVASAKIRQYAADGDKRV